MRTAIIKQLLALTSIRLANLSDDQLVAALLAERPSEPPPRPQSTETKPEDAASRSVRDVTWSVFASKPINTPVPLEEVVRQVNQVLRNAKRNTVQTNVSRMVSQGLLKHVGPSRSGVYARVK